MDQQRKNKEKKILHLCVLENVDLLALTLAAPGGEDQHDNDNGWLLVIIFF